jgi:hypothetical protein
LKTVEEAVQPLIEKPDAFCKGKRPDRRRSMKLISAHVTNFRSVENSGEFSVEQVTCLVGKNEADKSATLPSSSLRWDEPAPYKPR